MFVWSHVRTCALGAGLLALLGCGGSESFSVAPTRGRVVCEGQAVPFVTVFFEPLPSGTQSKTGKSAVGYANERGEFTLTTYQPNDGAVVGKHRVMVGPPAGENAPQDFKCDCVLNERAEVMQVDIAGGKTNEFELVLKVATAADKAAAAQAATRQREDD